MARRNGWATCVAGLHACLLAGCLHTAPPPSPSGPDNPPGGGPEVSPTPRSPYPVRSTDISYQKPAADKNPPPVDPGFKRTSQPDDGKPVAPDDVAGPTSPPNLT